MEGRDVTFVIGDATAFRTTLLDRAERRWSLGPLTLPHELARVVLYEQLVSRAHHPPRRKVPSRILTPV